MSCLQTLHQLIVTSYVQLAVGSRSFASFFNSSLLRRQTDSRIHSIGPLAGGWAVPVLAPIRVAWLTGELAVGDIVGLVE